MSDADRAAMREVIEPAMPSSELNRLGGRAWAIAAVVFLFALCCYVPMLGQTQISGTEGHRALTAHQMVESGEWLVPRMFGRIYLAKPPLHYWVLATLEKVTGSATPLIWRLPAAIDGALIATFLCLFGYRWFGEMGGAVSGFAYVGLLTMWGEHRGAELDATNTLSATVAALCLIELNFGALQRRWLWILAAGVAAGASFMVKGPASLTILIGVLIWAGIDAVRRQKAADIGRFSMWLPMLIGAAIFGIYAMAVRHYLMVHHLPLDLSGVREGVADAHPLTWDRWVHALLMPPTMFAYSLPVSLALPMNFLPVFRETIPTRRRISTALAWSVLLGWGMCVAVGMHNPRYGFITLPLLGSLAGAIASRYPRLELREKQALRTFVNCTGIGFAMAILAMSFGLRKQLELRTSLLTISIVADVCVVLLVYLLGWRKQWRAGLLVLVLIALASLTFAIMKNQERVEHSCQAQANEIREIVGPGGSLVTCMMVLDQPDLFYFSGLPTRALDGNWLDWRELPTKQWVVLEKPEIEIWNVEVPGRMVRVHQFDANRNRGWLVLYDPAAAAPSTTAFDPAAARGRSGRAHHGH